MVAWQAGQAAVAKMELEASYDESYCLEGRAERQRGATDATDEAREAVGMACVDRHIRTELLALRRLASALINMWALARARVKTNKR